MLNIEKYKNFVMNNLNWCQMETDVRKAGGKANIDCAHTLCEDCKESFFKWLLEEYKNPILVDKEKEYLSAVIEPFRDKVKYISKIGMEQFISIVTEDGCSCCLPYFTCKKYEGMTSYREYTLEELGL